MAGYPNFGKVKTLVLPLPERDISIDEYKDLYGIDLREFIELTDDKSIQFKDGLPNTLVLIDDITLSESSIRLNSVTYTMHKNYIEGNQDAVFGLAYYGDGDGFGAIWELVISKNEEFKIENIKVLNFEL